MSKHMLYFSIWMNKDAKWRLDVFKAIMSILLKTEENSNQSVSALIKRVDR